MPQILTFAQRHGVAFVLLAMLDLVLVLVLLMGCLDHPCPPTTTLALRGHPFAVELATTPRQWARGLMDRPTLPADHGMLFVFPTTAPRDFWMKRTQVALDILFFDDQQRLVGQLRDVPPCTGDPCPHYPSPAPARYVLELPAGTAAAIKIQPGDRFTR